MAFATAVSRFAFLPPAAPRPWNWRPGSFVRKIPPPRTCASGSYRRERSSPPPGANCLGCNPRARALSSCTGASVACRPLARIDSGGTPPRTRASGSYRRERSSPPPGANCPGCNPRARALSSCTGASVAYRPLARIDSGGTPPRTCASGSMSTSGSERLACRLGRSWTVPTGDQDPKARIARGATPANCPALPCGMFAWEITIGAHVRQRFVQA